MVYGFYGSYENKNKVDLETLIICNWCVVVLDICDVVLKTQPT